LLGAPRPQQLHQYKAQRVRRDSQARRAQPEIRARTPIGTERTNKNAWTRKSGPMSKNVARTKNVAMTKDALTKKLKNVKTLVVQGGSTFTLIPTEKRFAFGTN
jgi:hypothetical protein